MEGPQLKTELPSDQKPHDWLGIPRKWDCYVEKTLAL
jgi:hypothetical protein